MPAHAAILRAHLDREGQAVLTEAPTEQSLGWLGGHVHEIALPLIGTRPPAPCPLAGVLPEVTNSSLGHVPGSAAAPWLNAKIYTHPDLCEELITTHLPRLLARLPGAPTFWFVRYRTPHDSDHMRLRIRVGSPEHHATCTTALAQWAIWLRRHGVSSRLVFDTYTPEIGRYGPGAAMRDAESVFAADSGYVLAALHGLPSSGIDGLALAAVGMVDIACGFLGPEQARQWLASRPARSASVDRAVSHQAIDLVRSGTPWARGWSGALAEAWQRRAAALALYRGRLPDGMDTDAVLQSGSARPGRQRDARQPLGRLPAVRLRQDVRLLPPHDRTGRGA